MLRSALPRGRDWLGVALLGVMFFAVFFVFYNIAMAYTTAARGALALSTLAALDHGGRRAARRRAADRAQDARRADRGRRCRAARWPQASRRRRTARGAAISSWSARRSAWRSTTSGRGRSSRALAARVSSPPRWERAPCCLVLVAALSGGFAVTRSFDAAQWIAVIYLGVFGGAAAFFLWVLALRMTTPTRVANTMTVNPIAASLLAAVIVGEPIGLRTWWRSDLARRRGGRRSGLPRQSGACGQKNEQGQSPARIS